MIPTIERVHGPVLLTLAAILLFACSSPTRSPGEAAAPAQTASVGGGGGGGASANASGGEMTLSAALTARRSERAFAKDPLTAEQLDRLLWAGQGVTSDDGKRTAPSAGALYPLELHVLTAEGVFRYDPASGERQRLAEDDRRERLSEAALNQWCVRDAPAVFVIWSAT